MCSSVASSRHKSRKYLKREESLLQALHCYTPNYSMSCGATAIATFRQMMGVVGVAGGDGMSKQPAEHPGQMAGKLQAMITTRYPGASNT